MDILVLIDKLDEIVQTGRPVPLTDQVRVNKDEIHDILDRMRAAIPELMRGAPGAVPAGGVDQEALNRAVAAAIRENAPAIAQAVAAAVPPPGARPPEPRPPGAPF